MKKVVLVEEPEFSKEFIEAAIKFTQDERVNGYERLYVDYDILQEVEEWDEEYVTIQKTFKEKGFTEEDVILLDNTW